MLQCPGGEIANALASETSSRSGSESASLSSGTKFEYTEGAGEWSPSRLESGGRVRIRGVRFLRPLPGFFGKQARLEEQRTPNPLLQSSNLWFPAIEGEADGKPPHFYRGKRQEMAPLGSTPRPSANFERTAIALCAV